MDLSMALFQMRRLPFPVQRGEFYLKLPVKTQAEILRHEDLDLSFFIAFKPIFNKLTRAHQILLASHKNCDPALLILLSQMEHKVRVKVASNPSTPNETLLSLSNDQAPDMAQALLKNPRIKS